jgi:hypothetical protein
MELSQSIAPSLIAIRVALDLDFKEYRSEDNPKPTPRITTKIEDTVFEEELGHVVGGAEPRSAREEESIRLQRVAIQLPSTSSQILDIQHESRSRLNSYSSK